MESICVYCGSSDKIPEIYYQAATDLAKTIARRGLRLIYGAGSTGLMGALADATLQEGGEVIGVIPHYFNTPVLAHPNLTHLEIVDTLHQRKARMVELADAFIALPGGFGTLEEFFEVLTWAQIGLHRKPIGLLNTSGYYNLLVSMIEKAQQEGFIYDEHRALFYVEEQPADLLVALQNHLPPSGLERWMTRDK